MVYRWVILGVVLVFVAIRLWQRTHGGRRVGVGHFVRRVRVPLPDVGSSVGLVAEREIRERVRSRTFRIGTIIILLVVVLGIVIPVINNGSHHPYKVAVVGPLSSQIRQTVLADATAVGVTAQLVDTPDAATAKAELAAGKVKLVIVNGEQLVVNKATSANDSSGGALFVGLVATSVARQRGIESAGFSPAQAAKLANPAPLPVASLQPATPGRHRSTEKATALYGLILIYVLLTQYGTWIMMGVVEEKSSRVVEVLLAAMKPAQLLAGKVLGIGTVALAQAALLVVVALGLAAAVGSDLVKGAAPTQVVSVLVWLLLGYAFYCWVYAAGGSLADRQEHVQTLAFPLQIPVLFGYISSLISLSSTSPSAFVHVLAYIPMTAPFAMNVLVADGSATWWQFVLSALISIAGTVALAQLATTVYRRAVLQTGRRLKLSEVLRTA